MAAPDNAPLSSQGYSLFVVNGYSQKRMDTHGKRELHYPLRFPPNGPDDWSQSYLMLPKGTLFLEIGHDEALALPPDTDPEILKRLKAMPAEHTFESVNFSFADVIQLSDKNFDKGKKTGAVLVEFGADWCKPCQGLKPQLGDLARQTRGKLTVAQIDSDESSIAKERYGIQAAGGGNPIPLLVLFKDGKEIARYTGFMKKDELAAWVSKNGVDLSTAPAVPTPAPAPAVSKPTPPPAPVVAQATPHTPAPPAKPQTVPFTIFKDRLLTDTGDNSKKSIAIIGNAGVDTIALPQSTTYPTLSPEGKSPPEKKLFINVPIGTDARVIQALQEASQRSFTEANAEYDKKVAAEAAAAEARKKAEPPKPAVVIPPVTPPAPATTVTPAPAPSSPPAPATTTVTPQASPPPAPPAPAASAGNKNFADAVAEALAAFIALLESGKEAEHKTFVDAARKSGNLSPSDPVGANIAGHILNQALINSGALDAQALADGREMGLVHSAQFRDLAKACGVYSTVAELRKNPAKMINKGDMVYMQHAGSDSGTVGFVTAVDAEHGATISYTASNGKEQKTVTMDLRATNQVEGTDLRVRGVIDGQGLHKSFQGATHFDILNGIRVQADHHIVGDIGKDNRTTLGASIAEVREILSDKEIKADETAKLDAAVTRLQTTLKNIGPLEYLGKPLGENKPALGTVSNETFALVQSELNNIEIIAAPMAKSGAAKPKTPGGSV